MDKYKNQIQLITGNKEISKAAQKKINNAKKEADEKRKRNLSFTPFGKDKSFLGRRTHGKETERHLSYHRDSDGARFKTDTQLELESKAGRDKLESLEKELLKNLKKNEENRRKQAEAEEKQAEGKRRQKIKEKVYNARKVRQDEKAKAKGLQEIEKLAKSLNVVKFKSGKSRLPKGLDWKGGKTRRRKRKRRRKTKKKKKRRRRTKKKKKKRRRRTKKRRRK